MSIDKKSGVLFSINDKKYVTLTDNRSKNRFKKLIKNWYTVSQIFDNANEGDVFEFIPLTKILGDIESMYNNIKHAPAIEKIANNVFKTINIIKIQNGIELNVPIDPEDLKASEQDEEDE